MTMNRVLLIWGAVAVVLLLIFRRKEADPGAPAVDERVGIGIRGPGGTLTVPQSWLPPALNPGSYTAR